MKKDRNNAFRTVILSICFIILCSVIFCACRDGNGENTTDVSEETTGTAAPARIIINPISRLNTDPVVTDDHAAETGSSSIELNFREYYEFGYSDLGVATAYYPRIKQLPDKSFIMFYNDGRTGPNIYYIKSDDTENWSRPKKLFATHGTTQYATCDGVVLENGDILVACSFRSTNWNSYISDMKSSGIAIKRSRDNGTTWSEEEIVYYGMNWEPCLLQLESGEIQIYFTHSGPYTAIYGYNNDIRSTGAALLRSFDGGKTWQPFITEYPFAAYRVMQTYIGDKNGIRWMNDQMPVAIQLHSGNIALAAETLSLDKKLTISIGYSSDNWAKELGIDEAGPADKKTQWFSGAGPYLAQFASGETLLSYAAGNNLNIKLGSADARTFYSAYTPFSGFKSGTALWPTLEIKDTHSVIALTEYISSDAKSSRIALGTFYLNHRINAKEKTIKADGDNSDWSENTDALFVGSVSQAQTVLRAGYDDDRVYLLCERLDRYLDKRDDEVVINISKDSTIKEYYRITLDWEGIARVQLCSGSKYEDIDINGALCALTVNGTVDDPSDEDEGYIAELSLPRSLFGSANALYIYVSMNNKDNGKKFDADTFTNSQIADGRTWQVVKLGK